MTAQAAITSTPLETLDECLERSKDAWHQWSTTPASVRGRALRMVADVLEERSSRLIELAVEETHIPEQRLQGEVLRTSSQLRFFADLLDAGKFLDATIDRADPEWPAGGRPDIRRMLIPLGPAAVFAASNFPFAFGVAGGDTASALAAGCSVMLKAHPGHPRLSQATGDAVRDALEAAGASKDVVQVIYGEEAGRAALMDRRIKVGAFTGSLRGGRALFDLASSRPDPIPFFGELGSLNPVFVTPGAARERIELIFEQFAASYTFGAGQLCTKPGLLFVPVGSVDERAARDTILGKPALPMLNPHIQQGYQSVLQQLASHPGVRTLAGGTNDDGETPGPTLLATTASELLTAPHELLVECFGPTALIVTYESEEQLMAAAATLDGQLTATIHSEPDELVGKQLSDIMALIAGRIISNGWPIGLPVTWATQHGGPYPATTAPSSTSVGASAISRFQRPVAFQNFRDEDLPTALQDANPLKIPRSVDGRDER